MIPGAAQFALASSSPRRRELLAALGLRFEIIEVQVDETVQPGETPKSCATRLARAKAGRAAALTASGRGPGLPILAADTCVAIDGRILGKPGTAERAESMLRQLSGRAHDVFTAVALKTPHETRHTISHTRVTFKSLTGDEIERYCARAEPLDKAGAYAVQGAASAFVKRIEGSYTGVVGLPLFETRSLLTRIGIDWL